MQVMGFRKLHMTQKNGFFMLFISAGLFLFISALPAIADEPKLEASVDKSTARLNEEIHLNIKVVGVRGALPAPHLPKLEAFDIFYSGRASHFSFVNGRTESMTEFNYVLIPKSVGTFILRPIEITIDNQVYKTDQLEIKIENGAAPIVPSARAPVSQTAQPRAPAPFRPQQGPYAGAASQPVPVQTGSDSDDNIFLRVRPTKLSVYANEQLILIYSLLTRYDTRYEGFDDEPETSGFWIEEFPMERDIGRDTEVVNGKKYVRADIKKLALFPTAPGEYTIKPGVIKTSVQIEEPSSSLFDEFFNDSFFSGGGLFARRVERKLTAPPIQIQVKPLPETGKPAGFEGAVGDFRMATSLDKRVVKQNEAVTLTITIEGEGNIETLAPPQLPEISGTKSYPSDTRTEPFSQKDRVAGRKTIEMIIIPQEAGELKIPPLVFSFFNPKLEQYVVLKSEPYKINVEPSSEPAPQLPTDFATRGLAAVKKEIQLESEGIQYIRERIRPARFILPRIVFWLAVVNGGLTLLTVAALIYRRRHEFLEQNVPIKRALFARKTAGEGLKRLHRMTKSASGDSRKTEAFFEESAKVLNRYLADKLNLSPQGLTQYMIEDELQKLNANPETVQKIRECFEACDQVRFGRMSSAGLESKIMVQKIREIIEVLERL